jgi:periplasmic protein TonB
MKSIITILSVFVSLACLGQEDLTAKPPAPATRGVDTSKVYMYVDVPGEFPGGQEGYKAYVEQYLQYPAAAKEKGLQGKCYVMFVVTWEGKPRNPKVVRGIPDCPECDAEAIRLINAMPLWKPAVIGGKAVNWQFTMPVTFKMAVEENKQ